MSIRTANINVRIEPEIKAQAEAILGELGISASAFFNMAYRQVIRQQGIPFPMTLRRPPRSLEQMSKNEFDEMMARGLSQAKSGDVIPCEEAFDKLLHTVEVLYGAVSRHFHGEGAEGQGGGKHEGQSACQNLSHFTILTFCLLIHRLGHGGTALL